MVAQNSASIYALSVSALILATVVQVVAGKRFAIANADYPFVTTQVFT